MARDVLPNNWSDLLILLADPEIVEIMLNPDGSLWVDRLGVGMERVGTLDAVRSLTIITTVAALLDTVVTPDRPILECELPLDGSRFEALIPPLVERPTFARSCRWPVSALRKLRWAAFTRSCPADESPPQIFPQLCLH